MTESVLSELGAASTCQTCRLPSSVHVSAVGGVAVCLSSQMHVLLALHRCTRVFFPFRTGGNMVAAWVVRGNFQD